MGKKFIPNGDQDFVMMAERFARVVADNPQHLEIAAEESARLTESVKRFRSTLQQATGSMRTPALTRAKEDARAEVEQIIRRMGHLLRSNARIDAATKLRLGIQPRQTRPKMIPCPQEPPTLRFVRALHQSGATPMHELSFTATDFTKAKPAGAVRLELFVDLIPPDEKIPGHPGANYGGRPWYLRSYTRSPIVLQPPMARVPMRVVYWGRWADSSGEVGPFSATAVAWIEGGSQPHLPGAIPMRLNLGLDQTPQPQLVDAAAGRALPGPDDREVTYRVAVMEVQVQSMQELPEPKRETRRLEGPTPDEASEAA